jgi:hypothetical protein
MPHPPRKKIAATFVIMVAAAGYAGAAHAQQAFSNLFGGAFFNRPPPTSSQPMMSPMMAFGNPQDEARPVVRIYRHRYYHHVASPSSRDGFCVRSCDGRYFPVPGGGDGESAETICNNFCPASPTKVVYGSSIDSATTSSGQNYSDLPNAFRYRNEIVNGCTCNGKDAMGLAAVKVEDDHTLRKGDIVVGANGLVIATGRFDKNHVANFSPAPASIRNKFERASVLASE